jgi:polyhydroxybutyrate depolymerase
MNTRHLLKLTALIFILSISSPAALAESPTTGQMRESITIDGILRSYLLFVPSGYRTGMHYPLLIVLHNNKTNAIDAENLTGFSVMAIRKEFIVAYPEAVKGSWAPVWSDAGSENDLKYLKQLSNEIVKNYQVDENKIFLVGLGEGADTALALAIGQQGYYAALATVSGSVPNAYAATLPFKSPLPILMIAGKSDIQTPWLGNERHLPVEDSFGFWMFVNGIANSSRKQKSDVKETYVLHRAGGKTKNQDVLLYAVTEGGYAYPGAGYLDERYNEGKVSMEFNASEEIWNFFSTHRRP